MPAKMSLGALTRCDVIRWSEWPFRKIPSRWCDNRIGWRESQAWEGDKEAWEPTRTASQGHREAQGIIIFRRQRR